MAPVLFSREFHPIIELSRFKGSPRRFVTFPSSCFFPATGCVLSVFDDELLAIGRNVLSLIKRYVINFMENSRRDSLSGTRPRGRAISKFVFAD